MAEQDEVADQLESARLVWLRTGDEKTLRRALLDILRLFETGRIARAIEQRFRPAFLCTPSEGKADET